VDVGDALAWASRIIELIRRTSELSLCSMPGSSPSSRDVAGLLLFQRGQQLAGVLAVEFRSSWAVDAPATAPIFS
jgi:hypothetical protein